VVPGTNFRSVLRPFPEWCQAPFSPVRCGRSLVVPSRTSARHQFSQCAAAAPRWCQAPISGTNFRSVVLPLPKWCLAPIPPACCGKGVSHLFLYHFLQCATAAPRGARHRFHRCAAAAPRWCQAPISGTNFRGALRPLPVVPGTNFRHQFHRCAAAAP
jgi:hypothetical protein